MMSTKISKLWEDFAKPVALGGSSVGTETHGAKLHFSLLADASDYQVNVQNLTSGCFSLKSSHVVFVEAKKSIFLR